MNPTQEDTVTAAEETTKEDSEQRDPAQRLMKEVMMSLDELPPTEQLSSPLVDRILRRLQATMEENER